MSAIIKGNHEIPQCTFPCRFLIPPLVVIWLEGASQITALAMESTLNKVREGNRTIAFAVNTTGSRIIVNQGVFFFFFLSHALAFDEQVMSEPEELSHGCVGAIDISFANDKTT